MGVIAAEAAVAIERAALLDRLERMARTDELTGLTNRRAWDQEVAREVSRAEREQAPLAIAMLDLDLFKLYNDRLGHQAGDRLLKEAAGAWRGVLRETDLHRSLRRRGVRGRAPRLRHRARREPGRAAARRHPGGQSCSAGLASWNGEEACRRAPRPRRRGPLPGQAGRARPDGHRLDNPEGISAGSIWATGNRALPRCGPLGRGANGTGSQGALVAFGIGRGACRFSPTQLPLRAIGLLAPPTCLCCRAPLAIAAARADFALGCEAEIGRYPGRELRGESIDGGFAPLDYAGAGRRLVAALKFGRLLAVADLAAALIVAGVPRGILGGAIVPVAAAPVRLAGRGFDPAQEIASAISRATGLEVAECLRRRDAGHQRGRSRAGRIAAAPRFSAITAAPRSALLVDDVTTTGATMDACARALRLAGCESVFAVALAAVPPRRFADGFWKGRVAWGARSSLGYLRSDRGD